MSKLIIFLRVIFSRKYSLTDERLSKLFINEELKLYNTNFDEILEEEKEGLYNLISWYQYYTFESKKDYDNWIYFMKIYLRYRVYPKISSQQIEKEIAAFDLNYGLKQDYQNYEKFI